MNKQTGQNSAELHRRRRRGQDLAWRNELGAVFRLDSAFNSLCVDAIRFAIELTTELN